MRERALWMLADARGSGRVARNECRVDCAVRPEMEASALISSSRGLLARPSAVNCSHNRTTASISGRLAAAGPHQTRGATASRTTLPEGDFLVEMGYSRGWGAARESLNALLAEGAYLEFVRALRACPPYVNPEGITTRADVALSAESLADLRRVSDDATALYVLGTAIWAEDGGEMEGIVVLGLAVELGSIPAVAALGESLHWMGDDGRAVPLLRRAVAHSTTRSPWLEGLLGEALLLVGEVDEAGPLLRSSCETYAEFGLALAKLRLATGQREEARTLLEKAAAENVYGAAILLGNLLDEGDEVDEAISAYRAGIAQGDAHSAFNLGVLMLGRGDKDAAHIAFDVARSMGDLTAPPAV